MMVNKSLGALSGSREPSPSSSTAGLGPSGFDPARWQWWSGPDDVFYRCGPYDTREEAIAVALSDYDDCSHIYVIEAVQRAWPAPDATHVIEYMFDNSEDLFPEDYPDRCGTPEENRQAEQELQHALNAWMDKWRYKIFPTPTTLQCSRNAEAIAVGSEAGETPKGGSHA
jgi:hypothetical protein